MSKSKGTGYEALTLISNLGFTLAIPIVLGILIGRWIDVKLHTEMIFLIIFMILGIVAGGMGAYHQIMNITNKKK